VLQEIRSGSIGTPPLRELGLVDITGAAGWSGAQGSWHPLASTPMGEAAFSFRPSSAGRWSLRNRHTVDGPSLYPRPASVTCVCPPISE
jgi:hypothetical protein